MQSKRFIRIMESTILHIKTSITEDGPTPQMLISTCRSPALVYRSTTLSQTKVEKKKKKKKRGRTITPLLFKGKTKQKKVAKNTQILYTVKPTKKIALLWGVSMPGILRPENKQNAQVRTTFS